jgi:hypothetical protein
MEKTKKIAESIVEDMDYERDIYGVKHVGYLSPEKISRQYSKLQLEFKNEKMEDFNRIYKSL